MFGNFIYFIIVLLIYTTYQPTQETNFSLPETLALFISLTGIFTLITWAQFRKLESRLFDESFFRMDHRLDQRFNGIVTRQSIMAIVLFAINIYLLDLSSFLTGYALLAAFPTLKALIFLGLFIGYLAIVWYFAHRVYRKLYSSELSALAYVISNISFSIPILLPWLILSGVSDIIYFLPFQAPKQFLSTTGGEMIYFFVFLILVAVAGPLLIQKFWRCRPMEPGVVRRRIELICEKAELDYNDILYWPIFEGRMITAGVMGLVKWFRYILVTDALISLLRPEEVDTVIAHEIGHIKRKHLLFYLFFFVGYMLLTYATFDLIIYAILYAEPFYRFINVTGFNQAAVTSALFTIITITIFLIYFRYIFGFFMRNFERQADTYVYTLFNSAVPLITTFEKIAFSSGQSPDKPNWHHFSITQRIDFLKKCEMDRSWIDRHERKVKRGIGVYVAAMLILAGIGYHLNYGETGERLNARFLETILLREIERTGGNANLYSMLGDHYYRGNEYGETIRAYEQAIEKNPKSAHALNNLAWLYATCEEESYRDPQRSLTLAQAALEVLHAPYILDTLAQSYYVNGRYDDAIIAGKAALDAAESRKAYDEYKKHLEIFLDAAKKKRPHKRASDMDKSGIE